MRFALFTVFGAALVAGCSQNNAVQEVPAVDAMPTAGVYSSFSAKGGGQVMGDTFVRRPGSDPLVRVAAVEGDCWNGSKGTSLGPITICAPRDRGNDRRDRDPGNPTVGPITPPIAAEGDEEMFTAKYDRIEEVYGTKVWQDLDDQDQDAIRDFYQENGGDGDWSDFSGTDATEQADADQSQDDTAADTGADAETDTANGADEQV